MAKKMSAADVVRVALIWAEESMVAMIRGLHADDPHREEVKSDLKQLRAYRERRFGKRPDPLKGTKLVGLDELRKTNAPR